MGGWLGGICETYSLEPMRSAENVLSRPHLPERPSWYCQCGDEWPCRVAWVMLFDEYHADALRTVMVAFIQQAHQDLWGKEDAGTTLYQRFLAPVNEGPARAAGSAPVPNPE